MATLIRCNASEPFLPVSLVAVQQSLPYEGLDLRDWNFCVHTGLQSLERCHLLCIEIQLVTRFHFEIAASLPLSVRLQPDPRQLRHRAFPCDRATRGDHCYVFADGGLAIHFSQNLWFGPRQERHAKCQFSI